MPSVVRLSLANQASYKTSLAQTPLDSEVTFDGQTKWASPNDKIAATGCSEDGIPEWNARLEEIWISPGNDFRGHHGEARGEHVIESVSEVECVAGMGLKGDRYVGYKPDLKGKSPSSTPMRWKRCANNSTDPLYQAVRFAEF